MWGVIIAVCAAGIAASIAVPVFYVLNAAKKAAEDEDYEFDEKKAMGGIAIFVILACLCMIPITYKVMNARVDKAKTEIRNEKAETKAEAKRTREEASADAKRIREEAKAEERIINARRDSAQNSIKGEIKLMEAEARVSRDSINNAIRLMKAEAEIIKDSTKRAERILNKELIKLSILQTINELGEKIEERKKTKEKQSAEIEELKKKMEALKHANLSIASFKKIAQVGLLEMNLKHTLVNRDAVSGPPKTENILTQWASSPPKDTILMIHTQNLNGVKFGFDLNQVRVAKQGETYVISGISAIHIGTKQNIIEEVLAEYRRTTGKDKNGIDNIEIKKDAAAIQRIRIAANKYTGIVQKKDIDLKDNENEYLKDAVVEQARNFLTVILAPLCESNANCIRFTDEIQPNSNYLMDYLKGELQDKEDREKALSLSIEQINNETKRDMAEKKEQLEIFNREQVYENTK